jgi:hypothetical protein
MRNRTRIRVIKLKKKKNLKLTDLLLFSLKYSYLSSHPTHTIAMRNALYFLVVEGAIALFFGSLDADPHSNSHWLQIQIEILGWIPKSCTLLCRYLFVLILGKNGRIPCNKNGRFWQACEPDQPQPPKQTQRSKTSIHLRSVPPPVPDKQYISTKELMLIRFSSQNWKVPERFFLS